MPRKFEGQFKFRDKRDVNARAAGSRRKTQKYLRHRHFCAILKAGLPWSFAE
jgi:hypothetical protein